MSDPWEALDRKSIRAAEAKFGVRHPRHDEAALDDLCPNSGASKGVCGCAQDQTRAGLAGREEVLSILTDLIEHLRAWERSQRTDPVHNPDYLAWMADRAEARLRDVSIQRTSR